MTAEDNADTKPEAPKTSGLPEEMMSQFTAPAPKADGAENDETLIEKPQLGPVVLGGRKSYRRKIGIAILILVLLAIGAVLGYTYAQNQAAKTAVSSDLPPSIAVQ